MELRLKGRAAVVGGASSGLGRATATALAREGCRLLIWSRRADALEEVAAAIRAECGTEVATLSADASLRETAARVAEAAIDRLGEVDVLILNAGGPPTADPTATDPDEWRRTAQLLAFTPIELATALLPGMRQRGWGRIVAVLSSGVREPIPELVYSNAGRSALAAWLKTTARAVAADGVTVNGVMPGRIDTPRVAQLDSERANREGVSVEKMRERMIGRIPAGRYGQPEELAALAVFLASEPASYVTGQLIAVDGAMIGGY